MESSATSFLHGKASNVETSHDESPSVGSGQLLLQNHENHQRHEASRAIGRDRGAPREPVAQESTLANRPRDLRYDSTDLL